MSATVRYWGVIPAAGTGRRMGSSERPKQYLHLAGRTVLEWAVAPFLEHGAFERIVVALAPDDIWWRTTRLANAPQIACVAGGKERAESVRAGLQALAGVADPHDWVLVHDAARPCLTREALQRLVAAVKDEDVGGLLATPVVDTLKRADERGYVTETVPRAALWRALTPQMFRFELLVRALDAVLQQGLCVTDEAQAIEFLGLRPKLVECDCDNLKITTPPDLERAARILAARELR